jgi:hypothetical protein
MNPGIENQARHIIKKLDLEKALRITLRNSAPYILHPFSLERNTNHSDHPDQPNLYQQHFPYRSAARAGVIEESCLT